MPGPWSSTPILTTPSAIRQSIRMCVPGGAYFVAFSMRCSRIWRRRGASATAWRRTPPPKTTSWRPRIGDSSRTTSWTSSSTSGGADPAGPAAPPPPPVAPFLVARRATLEGRLLGQEVGVRPDDRERGSELVGDEGDDLGPGLVDRLELRPPLLRLLLLAALLADP